MRDETSRLGGKLYSESHINSLPIPTFFKEIDAEYSDCPYHTAVRWLSCGKVRFYNLQKEINLFCTDKNKADPILSNPVWVSKFSLLVEITSHINDFEFKASRKRKPYL